MLVASAAIGLIAPIGAQANDINIEGMNNYASSKSSSKKQQFNSKTFANELAKVNEKIEGLETQINEFEAGSFSDTTVLSQRVIFDLGAADYSKIMTDGLESAQFAYSYRMELNTSFTGDDNMYIRILSGNHADWMKSTDHGGYLGSVGKGNNLQVDKIWYSFPVGENNTVWVGPKIENYYMHGAAPSIYKPVTKQFALGGNGNAYGASTDTGAGWAYKGDNGFSISSNIGTKSKSTVKNAAETAYIDSGLLSEESKTSWATQVGYTQPRYSVSAIVNLKYNGWADGYLHTADADSSVGNGNHTAYGLRGWWRPEETGSATPSVTVGYDTTEYEGSVRTSDMWFVGLQWQDLINADDKIGLALAQPTKLDDETVDPLAWELYYSYKANDSVTITPTIFGGQDREGNDGVDIVGALVQTVFKF